MPDISSAILGEKLDFIEATGANTVIAGDTGCVYQMQGGLRRRDSNVKVIHIAEALAKSIRNVDSTGVSN
jgi:L-lactate dehydrogenase complex protein LldE